MTLDPNIPAGPLDKKWTNYKNNAKLVSPANKRKFELIIVGSGLAGASAAATLAEQGYKDLVFLEWFGFFAPGGTPAPVVMRANEALRAALAQKDVVEGLAVMGLEARSSTPQELATLLKESYDRWGPIVKKIGFSADS